MLKINKDFTSITVLYMTLYHEAPGNLFRPKMSFFKWQYLEL